MKKNIAVIGGGAAGMMAAYAAAKSGAQVTLYEKNEKLGKKIYITGKGRCNVTNDCSRDVFFDQVVTNPKFLYSAFETFDNQAVMQLLEQAGSIGFQTLRAASERLAGSFTYTVLDGGGRLYIVRGNNPFCLYHWPEQGLYLYTSTQAVLDAAVSVSYTHLRAHET